MGRGIPRGEMSGRRFDQEWIWRIGPIAPAQMYSHVRRAPSEAWPWLPICVATLACLAALATSNASCTLWVKGFWQKTCLPILRAFIVTTAWLWSGVATMTASMSFCVSSILRKSL